jgi:hypothetical protein
MISRNAQLLESGPCVHARNARNKRRSGWPENCPIFAGIRRRAPRAADEATSAARLRESEARRVMRSRTWRVDETTISWDAVGCRSGVARGCGGVLRFRGGGAGGAGTRRRADRGANQPRAAGTRARAGVDLPARHGPARVYGGCPAPDGLIPRHFSEKPRAIAASGRADEGLGHFPTMASDARVLPFPQDTNRNAPNELQFGMCIAPGLTETRC